MIVITILMTETEITTATLNCTSSGQHDDAVTHSLLDS